MAVMLASSVLSGIVRKPFARNEHYLLGLNEEIYRISSSHLLKEN